MENPEIWEQLVKQVEMRESQRQDAETGLDLAGSILGEEDNVMDKISCPQCSTALDASKNFCTQCGARLRPSTHSPLCQYGQNNSVSKTVRNGCLWATHDALGCLALKKCTQCGHDVGAGLRSCPHCKYTTFEILSEHFSAQAEAASLVNKGVQLWTSGKEDAAIRETARALQTNPWNASTHGNLGVFLYERGQYEQSAVLLERALLLDPDLEGAHDFLQKAIDASKRQDKRYAFIGLFFFMTQEAAARAIEAIPAWLASCFTEKPFVKRWIDNMTGQGFLPVFRDAVPALIRTCVGRTSLQLAVAASFAQIWYLILLMRSADSCLEVMSVLGQKECANCHLAVEEQYIQCPHCSCDQFIPGHLVGQQLLADLEPFTVREGGVYSVLAKGT